jgi:hypothetical protein
MAHYLIRLGDATSQFFNVLLFNGDPNHSISGDAYRFKRERLRQFIDWMFSRWEVEHCKASHENDVAKGCRLCEERVANTGRL